MTTRAGVATSQPVAAEAGKFILERGGSAMDAAIAAAAVLTVVEPTGCGLGSDAFCLFMSAGEVHGYNGSGRTSRNAKENFKVKPHHPSAVTVPGAVESWVRLHEVKGRLPFAELLAPAVEVARRGFAVTPGIARSWQRAAAVFQRPEWHATFAPGGRAPRQGERVIFDDHADTLEEIARSTGESFYKGALAYKCARYLKRVGSLIDTDDLAAHRGNFEVPLSVEVFGRRLVEMPPNGQGCCALIASGVLNECYDAVDLDDDQHLHMAIEAIKVGIRDTAQHVADPAHMTLAPETLIHPRVLDEAARSLDEDRAYDIGLSTPDGGTVLVVAADSAGEMVSFIQSNFHGFGSGLVVPGAGIALQNRALGFTAGANTSGPNKRPFHTILPAFVVDAGQPSIAFGLMGGAMQPQGHVQLLCRLSQGQSPQAAIDADRFQVIGREVALENGARAPALTRRGHRVRSSEGVFFGGAQMVARTADGFLFGSDKRRDGRAAVL